MKYCGVFIKLLFFVWALLALLVGLDNGQTTTDSARRRETKSTTVTQMF
jgi:hypothetical protein